MSVDREELKRIIKIFLRYIEKIDPSSFEEKERRIPISNDEFISLALRPSSEHLVPYSKAPTISYIKNKNNVGILLEVKINMLERYLRIILKTTEGVLPGYEPFAVDINNNIIQHKKIPSTNIEQVKEELKDLYIYLSVER